MRAAYEGRVCEQPARLAGRIQRDQVGVIGGPHIATEIKPTNPTPPVAPARKVERQDSQRREETPKQRTREDRAGREDNEPGIDTYA